MTDADINQLRDLLRAATPGPWKNHTHEEDEGSDWATISATPVVARSGYKWTPTVGVCDGGDSVENAKNAALIVAAVNALPGLLDEVERLRCDGFDSRHPAAQNILGRNARLSIALDIVRDILADDYEPTPITAEHWAPIHDQAQSVVRERNELRQEVERLRADAERYRWLHERAPFWAWQPDSNCYPGITVGFSHSGTKYCDYTLDAAIDAAMEEESGEQSTSSFENFMEIPYGAR